jgi:hypothetical protein
MKTEDKEIEDRVMLLEAYVGRANSILMEKIDEINIALKENKRELERLIEAASRKNEHSDYVKYLVSDDFEEKEKKLTENIEQLVASKIPKPNNSAFFTYLILFLLFVMQVVLIIKR